MRRTMQSVASWAVMLSLLSGLSLPFRTASSTGDSDGVCGPVLVLAHSIEHFEAPLPAVPGHCVLCHYWNAMASASLSPSVDVAPPVANAADAGRFPPDRADLLIDGAAAPRGPPLVS